MKTIFVSFYNKETYNGHNVKAGMIPAVGVYLQKDWDFLNFVLILPEDKEDVIIWSDDEDRVKVNMERALFDLLKEFQTSSPNTPFFDLRNYQK